MNTRLGLCTLLVLGLGCLQVLALPYGKDSGVITLTKENFAREVFSSEHVWLVEFYAPCGHCKQLAPEWEKAAKNLKGIVKVGAVNCDEEKELAGHFQIKGFPTIKVFPSALTPTPDKKGVLKEPEDYQGPRQAAALVNHALSKLPNFVTQVNAKNADEFLGKADLAKVLLFTDKPKTTDLYKALAIDFHFQLELGQVKNTETALVERFGVQKFPTLLVVPLEGEPVTYTGKLAHDELFKFLKPHAKAPAKSKDGTRPPPPPVQHDVRDEVITHTEFSGLCEQESSGNCVLVFLDPENTPAEEHARYVSVLEALNEKHGKYFRLLWLDAAAQHEFVQTFGLYSGFPAVVVYNHNKKAAVNFVGAFEQAAMDEFLADVLRGAGKKPRKIDQAPRFTNKKPSVPGKNIPTEEPGKDEL